MTKCLHRFATTVCAAAACFVAASGIASAQTTWVVSPAGNDANPGTAGAPFRTIQRAADVVNPGDIVMVEDGTYTGAKACGGNSRAIVCLNRGGVAGAPVTFRARNRGGARLDGQNNSSTDGFKFQSNANYVVVQGFEVFGVGNAAGSSSAFDLYGGGHDVVIAYNDVHHVGRLCTDTTNGQVGIFIQQPRVRVHANRIHDIGRFAPGENGCAPATQYYTNHDHGVYVNGKSSSGGAIPGASDAMITSNVFYNHARGWAVQVYPGHVARLSVLNNTFAFSNPYMVGQIILDADSSDTRIVNNIFYGARDAAINYRSGTHANLHVTNNLVYGTPLLNRAPAGAVVLANLTADPAFADLSRFDFHLTDRSPARDAGATLSEVQDDFDGTKLSGTVYDIGALEYLSSTAISGPSRPTVGKRMPQPAPAPRTPAKDRR